MSTVVTNYSQRSHAVKCQSFKTDAELRGKFKALTPRPTYHPRLFLPSEQGWTRQPGWVVPKEALEMVRSFLSQVGRVDEVAASAPPSKPRKPRVVKPRVPKPYEPSNEKVDLALAVDAAVRLVVGDAYVEETLFPAGHPSSKTLFPAGCLLKPSSVFVPEDLVDPDTWIELALGGTHRMLSVEVTFLDGSSKTFEYQVKGGLGGTLTDLSWRHKVVASYQMDPLLWEPHWNLPDGSSFSLAPSGKAKQVLATWLVNADDLEESSD